LAICATEGRPVLLSAMARRHTLLMRCGSTPHEVSSCRQIRSPVGRMVNSGSRIYAPAAERAADMRGVSRWPGHLRMPGAPAYVEDVGAARDLVEAAAADIAVLGELTEGAVLFAPELLVHEGAHRLHRLDEGGLVVGVVDVAGEVVAAALAAQQPPLYGALGLRQRLDVQAHAACAGASERAMHGSRG